MKDSKIEWTDHTFNPWEGCTKVSPGCAHCYAETRNQRWAGGKNWGPGAPRRRTSAANWKQPLKWNDEHMMKHRAGELTDHRPRVFCASIADWLDDEVDASIRADLLHLIYRCRELDWLLLTKRPQNWQNLVRRAASHAETYWAPEVAAYTDLEQFVCWLDNWLTGARTPDNIWVGTTVEDQTRADERIPHLLKIPAQVRFLSCEPLLGPIEFSNVTRRSDCVAQLGKKALTGIHWVIAGGESGPGARPMHPDWARSLRDQCGAVDVAFFFKQWGEWLPRSQILLTCNAPAALELVERPKTPSAVMRRDSGIDASLGEASTSNDAESSIYRVGKKNAGRLLDGREWSEFPAATY